MTYEDAERKRAEFLAGCEAVLPEMKAAITRAVLGHLLDTGFTADDSEPRDALALAVHLAETSPELQRYRG